MLAISSLQVTCYQADSDTGDVPERNCTTRRGSWKVHGNPPGLMYDSII